MFLMNKILSKSNSFKYFKSNFEKLNKENKNLKKKVDNLQSYYEGKIKKVNNSHLKIIKENETKDNKIKLLNQDLKDLNKKFKTIQSDYNKMVHQVHGLSDKIIDSHIKDNKEIIILFYGYDMEIGGLAKAVCDRANLLHNKGYSIKIINIDDMKNFKVIEDNFHKLGYLDKSLSIINIFDYYSNKYTFNSIYNELNIDELINNSDYKIEKQVNPDDSITLNYYDENGINFKRDLYISGCLSSSKKIKNTYTVFEEYYTRDGFKFIEIDKVTKHVILYDRLSEETIYLNDIKDFHDYFVTEICLKAKEKPFLICDASSDIPSIKNINPNIAYKIGNAHNNPYKDKPFSFGCEMRNISTINQHEYLDASVVLTNAACNDFIKEFGPTNFVVIPNFIKDNELCFDNTLVENKVISIFSRISTGKNISDLIKAFNIVLKDHDDAVLKIFGRALRPGEINEKDKLKLLISELCIEDNVKFMGHVDNAYEEMNKSLLTILTSDIEGLPMVILESMYNYTPMICYDINYGPRDVIENDIDGFVINHGDINSLAKKISFALDNPEEIYEMGFKAHDKIINNFSETAVLRKWEELFDNICNR